MSSESDNQETHSSNLLLEQQQQLTVLSQIITNEKEVLQQHDPQALLSISQEKNTILMAIQELDKKISLDQQFAQDRQAGKLTQQLNDIADLLAHCQKQNLVNGHIIQQSQLSVERMKTSLLESHNKNSITYDKKGKKSAGLSSLGLKA